jgi:predicted DNA-binding protein with PD1-like motif
MEYRRFKDTLAVRLDPKEEICEELLKIAETEQISFAEIAGLGAVNDFTVGVFDTTAKEYHANEFKGHYEIVSMTGTLTRKEGAPYLHVHFAAGDDKGNVVGGHLNRAIISATGEIIIRVIDGKVGRKFSDEIGLNLFEF